MIAVLDSLWWGGQRARFRFWLAHHVGVPLVAKALSCASRRADSLEDRLRYEVTVCRVARIANQVWGECDQGLMIYVDDTARRVVDSVERGEPF
jgi:hypothetical protein